MKYKKKQSYIYLIATISLIATHTTYSNPFNSLMAIGCHIASQNYSTSLNSRPIRRILNAAALQDPLARLAAANNFYSFTLTCIPFIGKHLQCTNNKCSGICNDCKLKFIYKEVPTRIMLMAYYTFLRREFSENIQLIPLAIWNTSSVSKRFFNS